MSRPEQDSKIATAFSALRQDEEDQCPPFAEVLRRARARSRWSTVRRRALVAATAMVGIAIIVLAGWIGLRRERPLEAIPSIVEWQSPTGFLLETPGREVLAAPAGLGRSVLDLASPTERRSPS
jgi:hypothetical protein